MKKRLDPEEIRSLTDNRLLIITSFASGGFARQDLSKSIV